ncbi:glycosyltransferase family A protein [Mucilaginibacter sp.]|uniref:glycosyltransferase family A protein n=1 Tax=Mucilaginibacter sp. TaxID=1882438 RepID=UPI0026393349|nr:glycosyltransferase family A protein [Mucilaginibacter sp.]MDB4919633.1 hypothetical protein [Mucilaginibacter sp.]
MITEGISVIICCYNSALRIEKALEYLAAQMVNDIKWEIILVDNASADNTAEIAGSFWSIIHSDKINLNIVSEPMPGLSFARLRGVSASAYEYLILCDDDNWLDENYLQNVYELFQANKDIGVIGGFGIARFEDPLLKPFWFDNFYHGYAVSLNAGEVENRDTVYGAGMAIRKSVLNMVTRKYPMFLEDRKKNQLLSGGDSEICMRVRLAGFRVLYSPKLTFIHFLSTNRLTWDHLKKLHTGFAKSNVILSLYNKALNTQSLKLPPFYWLRKALYYCGIYVKYWPKHYLAYSTGTGTTDEIHHITWKNIALNYFEYNFKTMSIYRKICTFKNNGQAG